MLSPLAPLQSCLTGCKMRFSLTWTSSEDTNDPAKATKH